MSSNLKDQFYKLELISNLKSLKSRRILLSEFGKDPRFCKAVREIVKNTKNNKIKLTALQKKKINRYKVLLNSILNKSTFRKRKQKLMNQTGTGVFLPIVVPLVASILQSLIK